jgi:SAM-dependent methyltransferase
MPEHAPRSDPGGYDGFAAFYARYWGPRYHEAADPVLERLAYAALPPHARVLDLCCGTGHLSARLTARGYHVMGADGSVAMLREAQTRLPRVPLWCTDVSALGCGPVFDAVLCTFDSLNHVLEPDALGRVCSGVARALRSGGRFVFDVNTTSAYAREWGKSSALVDPDAAIIIRGGYDPARRLGHTDLTLFWLADGWRRGDVRVWQRPWEPAELTAALEAAGFARIELSGACEAGMPGDIAVGRVFVVAVKP